MFISTILTNIIILPRCSLPEDLSALKTTVYSYLPTENKNRNSNRSEVTGDGPKTSCREGTESQQKKAGLRWSEF